MLKRQLRKVFGTGPRIVKVDDSSDSDAPVIRKDKIIPFALLDISSGPDAEPDTDSSPWASPIFKKKICKKNRKKNKKRSIKTESDKDIVHIVKEVSNIHVKPEVNEVPVKPEVKNILVKPEVNNVLVKPEVNKVPEKPTFSTRIPVRKDTCFNDISCLQFERMFTVNNKNLNAALKLEGRFGPDDDYGIQPIKKDRPKEVLSDHITPVEGVVKCNGISMSKCRTEDGFEYYTYNHSNDYQKRQKKFLGVISMLRNAILDDPNINTVEAEIEKIALLFSANNYQLAIKSLENLIAKLQCAADPTFSISNLKCRLEYSVVENRPFHIAVLQYSHVLSNKGFHRNALELAKVLLNLDPSDPLAVINIIDTYAIRAGEYEWLLCAIRWFERERRGRFLFNIQFSKALAEFYVATKNNESSDHAGVILKSALMLCPCVFEAIVRDGGPRYLTERVQKLLDQDFYKTENFVTKALHQLTKLYAAFLGSYWTEPPVFEWLVKNAEQVLRLVGTAGLFQEHAKHLEAIRDDIYKEWPVPVYRHMSVITPLSEFLVDGAVPQVPDFDLRYRFNPAKESNSVNRYGYKELPE